MNTHLILPNVDVNLDKIPTRADIFHQNRAEAEAEFKALRKELREWQARLYAEGKQKLLIVFQALDAGGKDGTIRNVFQGVNPQGVRVTSFKAPSKEELAHDFLWRVHQEMPAKGMIRVFNRSHYEDVLIVRVENIVPESVWRPRYTHINNFERLLVDDRTTILKFFLHISPEEQAKRLIDRIVRPEKNWKFSADDLNKRAQWADYRAAFNEAISETSTDYAPWHVIPADQKWYRNLAIVRTILGTIKKMNPQYPPSEDNLEQYIPRLKAGL
jgi:PPK2 family polyphosphate:nucleotide phosphotransferase